VSSDPGLHSVWVVIPSWVSAKMTAYRCIEDTGGHQCCRRLPETRPRPRRITTRSPSSRSLRTTSFLCSSSGARKRARLGHGLGHGCADWRTSWRTAHTPNAFGICLRAGNPCKGHKWNDPPRRAVPGVLQGGEICVLSVGGSRYQAPSGRLNRVEAVSARCAEPNPTKKIVATWSPRIPATAPATIVAAARL
jgi:hypothetical protein